MTSIAPGTRDGRHQFLRFCVVGASGYAVNIGAFAVALALSVEHLVAVAAGFGLAMASNFWFNRHWTFASCHRGLTRQAARFFTVSVAACLLAAAILELLMGSGLSALAAQPASVDGGHAAQLPRRQELVLRRPEPAPVAPPAHIERPNTWLVVPTYNEAENLEPFVRRVLPRLASAAGEHRVLIVDDSSPDGTGEIADRLAAELESVEVLHRAEKDGLGRAYAAGFERALAEGAELVMQMDVDFSHDPDHVPCADRGGRERRPGARVALRRRRRGRPTGASRAGCSAAAAPGTPARSSASPVARPHRRLQVLPARAARDASTSRLPDRRLRLPGRGDLPRHPRRGARPRGADPVPRPPGRRLEDELAGSSSRRSGGCSSCGWAAAPRPRPASLRAVADDRGIDGFEYTSIAVGPTSYRPGVAGAGPPVLLLHGFPQTHYCWHLVAPGARPSSSTVVVCDLKGYGDSRSEPGGPLGEGYGKREMAAELVELMARLGFERFAVVGHDRGGRVAYRMALDHPEAVERLGVLNIVPTVDQFERMAGEAALEYWPWFFLAQPPPFAERLVGRRAPSTSCARCSTRGRPRRGRSRRRRPSATCARSRRR